MPPRLREPPCSAPTSSPAAPASSPASPATSLPNRPLPPQQGQPVPQPAGWRRQPRWHLPIGSAATSLRARAHPPFSPGPITSARAAPWPRVGPGTCLATLIAQALVVSAQDSCPGTRRRTVLSPGGIRAQYLLWLRPRSPPPPAQGLQPALGLTWGLPLRPGKHLHKANKHDPICAAGSTLKHDPTQRQDIKLISNGKTKLGPVSCSKS